jgi:hypothetical protein
VAAAENPRVNIIGHPLTRKVGRRPPVQVDLDALYAACARTGTALEINASPDRMDLPPQHIAAAREAGVKFAIDTDAHSLVDLTNMRYGVAAARFGGLTPADVINAWPLDRLDEFLRQGRSSLGLLASSITSGMNPLVFMSSGRRVFRERENKKVHSPAVVLRARARNLEESQCGHVTWCSSMACGRHSASRDPRASTRRRGRMT